MNAPVIVAPVRKSVRVKAPVARAFDVFTSGLSRWWPLDHGVGGATSIVGKDFLPAIALEEPIVGQGHGAFCKWRDNGTVPLICPTCQNVFAGIAQSIHASDRHATLHGVVFDILVGSESRGGPCGCVAAPRVALSWK